MPEEVIPPARPARRMMIKGLSPSLPERGHVKIGIKGAERKSSTGTKFQPPQKLDHFRVTTLERGPDGNFKLDEEIHERLGGAEPTEIPIRLLYDDIAMDMPTRLACYVGRLLWCSGDGEQATRLSDSPPTRTEAERFQASPRQVSCPCHRSDPAYTGRDKCKMNGALGMIIEGASGLGGVWKFRTTSWNSITGLLSSMSFIKHITGGVLANIPLKLRIQPKQAVNPTDGSAVLIYVVTIEYEGTAEELQQLGHKIALERAQTHMDIARIELEARQILALPRNAPLPGDVDSDVIDEFYPEQREPVPPRPRRQDFGPDKQKGEAEAGADAGQATTAASARNQQAASSPKDAVGDTGGGDVAPGAEAGGGSVSEAASSLTAEAEDGSEKPFSFADQFGEIHEFADLDEALQALATQVLGVAEMKHLEALGENGQALCEVAEDTQLVGVRDAWKKAKARLTAPPPPAEPTSEPEKTVSDNPLHDELCALPDVKSIQARWIKLTTEEKAGLPWKTWKEYAAKIPGATPS